MAVKPIELIEAEHVAQKGAICCTTAEADMKAYEFAEKHDIYIKPGDYIVDGEKQTTYLVLEIKHEPHEHHEPGEHGMFSGHRGYHGGTIVKVAIGSFAAQPDLTLYAKADLSNVTGTLAVAHGGTGLTALGTAGQVLATNGEANAMEWKDAGGGA